MGGGRLISGWIADTYRRNHENALAALDGLDEDGFRWRPPRSNSIAFNLWHLARWADRQQAQLGQARADGPPSTRRAEIWEAEGLARAWSFPAELGGHDTGMELDEEAAARLPFPSREPLTEYARRAFLALDGALEAISDEELSRAAPAAKHLTVGEWLLSHVRHEARHLGMIEALKGARGLRGTVTV